MLSYLKQLFQLGNAQEQVKVFKSDFAKSSWVERMIIISNTTLICESVPQNQQEICSFLELEKRNLLNAAISMFLVVFCVVIAGGLILLLAREISNSQFYLTAIIWFLSLWKRLEPAMMRLLGRTTSSRPGTLP